MKKVISRQLEHWVVWLSTLLGVAVGSSYSTLAIIGKEPLVPALFIFGDSDSDPGNNNHLISLAKSNYPPYGREFDTHIATGRFTNGRTAMDYLAAELGLPLVPPFMDSETKGLKLLQGVNYASAGSGILNSTGMFFGELIPLWKQLEYFRDHTQPEVYKMLGRKAGKDFFRKSLFCITSGSNDVLNGYYFLIPTTPHGLSIQELIQLLVWTVSVQLQVLYEFGARKVVVTGLAPLGCCPSQIAKYNLTTGECVGFLNDVSKQYNAALMTMLLKKREKLKDFHLVYSNLYDILMELIANPAMYGFNFSNTACCGVGKLNGKFICTAFSRPCDYPRLHIFFDYYHPTDTMYYLIFRKVYFEGPPYNIPYSAQSLVHVPI